jgi:hypothetical protein
MKKVMIRLDEDVAVWARIQAAELDISLSLLVTELLRDKMKEGAGYASAMKRYLSSSPKPLKKPGDPYPKRNEILEHTNLRCHYQNLKKA